MTHRTLQKQEPILQKFHKIPPWELIIPSPITAPIPKHAGLTNTEWLQTISPTPTVWNAERINYTKPTTRHNRFPRPRDPRRNTAGSNNRERPRDPTPQSPPTSRSRRFEKGRGGGRTGLTGSERRRDRGAARLRRVIPRAGGRAGGLGFGGRSGTRVAGGLIVPAGCVWQR